jgi:hypothetical protein
MRTITFQKGNYLNFYLRLCRVQQIFSCTPPPPPPPTPFPPTAAITRRKEPLEGRCCITNDQNACACETIPVLQSSLNIAIVQKCLLNRPLCLAATHVFYNIPATGILYFQSKGIRQITSEVVKLAAGAISK